MRVAGSATALFGRAVRCGLVATLSKRLEAAGRDSLGLDNPRSGRLRCAAVANALVHAVRDGPSGSRSVPIALPWSAGFLTAVASQLLP